LTNAKDAANMFAYRYGKQAHDFATNNGVKIDLEVQFVVLNQQAGGQAGRTPTPKNTIWYEKALRTAYNNDRHQLLWDNSHGDSTIPGISGLGEPWKNPQLAAYWLANRLT
jgi:hypothetical protein